VGSNLLVELDKGCRLGGVLLVGSGTSEDGALLLDKTSGLGNLPASPVDSVDPARKMNRSAHRSLERFLRLSSLLSEKADEAELVVRALFASNVLVDAAVVAMLRELLMLASLLVLLSDDLGGELEDLGLG
jgi:hypothetical protein